MQIPTVKKLLTYISNDGTAKQILSDIQEDTNDKYGNLEFQNRILNRCPFEYDGKYHDEIHATGNNTYEITIYDYNEPIARVNVIVNDVLEYNGKAFILQEQHYDEVD